MTHSNSTQCTALCSFWQCLWDVILHSRRFQLYLVTLFLVIVMAVTFHTITGGAYVSFIRSIPAVFRGFQGFYKY